jgi:hypothetical protein
MSEKSTPWTWHLGVLPQIDAAQMNHIAMQSGRPLHEVQAVAADMLHTKVFINGLYQVNVRRRGDWIELSIKRRNKKPMGPERYRHFQRIKNELIGPEHEAAELFPAESRLLDSANQYQIFVHIDPTYRFPFGVNERLVSDTKLLGSVQQPFEPVEPASFGADIVYLDSEET